MMKNCILFLLAFSFIADRTSGQAILNSGFESWITTGQGWDDPESWISSNSSVLGGDVAVVKSMDTYTGTYSSEITTLSLGITGLPYSGLLLNGSVMDTEIISGGTPISYMPSNLSGFYKYSSDSIGDSAHVIVILKKYNISTNKRDTIGLANAKLGAASSYTNFNIAINELQTGINPDSIVIAFYSSTPDNAWTTGFRGGKLLIDDIALDSTVGIEQWKSQLFVNVFPNPNTGRITLAACRISTFHISSM